MEVKNGIIIYGVLHEAVSCRRNISCSICSLQSQCEELERQTDKWLCELFDCWGFVNRGKVTNIEIEEAENENGKYDIQ